LQDDRQHAVAIAQHVAVPEAHHPIALLADEFEAAPPPIAHRESQLAHSVSLPAAQATLDTYVRALGTAHAPFLD